MAKRMVAGQRLTALLVVVLALAACGAVTTEPVEHSGNQQVTVVEDSAVERVDQEQDDPAIPQAVDPYDFAGAERPVPLPQLVGLTEADARQWATVSGFATVARSDGDYPEYLDPTYRVILEVGSDGRVLSAAAG